MLCRGHAVHELVIMVWVLQGLLLGEFSLLHSHRYRNRQSGDDTRCSTIVADTSVKSRAFCTETKTRSTKTCACTEISNARKAESCEANSGAIHTHSA